MARETLQVELWGQAKRGRWHMAKSVATSANANTFITWQCGSRSVNAELLPVRGEGQVCTGCLKHSWTRGGDMLKPNASITLPEHPDDTVDAVAFGHFGVAQDVPWPDPGQHPGN